MQLEDLRDRRVGLLGFGREGQAFERAMAARGVAARVTVLAESAPLRSPAAWPLEVAPMECRRLDFDVVVRSPGVPVDHPALAAYRTGGGTVINSSSIWFAERPEARVIAVTGSKGKSTTAALIAHLLEAAGARVALAGNIGVALLDHLDSRADWFVVELSSFQLADLQGRPEIGVVTRLFPEHADWHGSAEAYFACKLRLLELLAGNPLIVNAGDDQLAAATAAYPNRIEANRPPYPAARTDGIYLGERCLVDRKELELAGRHNLDNLAVALACAGCLGHRAEALIGAATRFAGLPHRLEPVAANGSRLWINDSIATTPYATLAALEAFDGRAVVLIAGGLERGGDWTTVTGWCRARALAGLVTLPDNGPRIAAELIAEGAVDPDRVRTVDGLEAGVRAAAELAGPDAVILLSPGAPSFPAFRDFEDRGNQFRHLVRAMDLSF